MEVNHFTSGKSDEQKYLSWSSSSDDQQLSTSSRIRSYTCSFCKKGFSSAQALGGHMNIHRRDRAKLIEAFYDDENMLSLNSMHPPDVDHRQVFEDGNLVPSEARTSEEESSIPKTSSSLSIENDDTATTLCASTSSGFCPDHGGEDTKLQMIQWPTRKELDLELRLGIEPPETSSSSSSSTSTSTTASTTTREFG